MNKNSWYLKYFIIGIFLLLLYIAYQLSQKNGTPTTELDCLKLGSNERAAACLKLVRTPKPIQDFPLSNLTLENIKATNTGFCIEISGTISNNSNLTAIYINLRTNFTKSSNENPFHYEIFGPFSAPTERLQPNSKKTFTKCMSYQSYEAVKDVPNWLFAVTPYSAKISEE